MSLRLPAGLTERPLTMADAPEVTGVLAASERHFVGEAFIDESDVIGMWSTEGRDLATDTLAVLDDGRIVAGAEVNTRRHLLVEVLPSHLGRGIGTALADWAEGLARGRGWEVAEQQIASADTAGAEILAARGYERVSGEWVLRLDEDAPLRRHALPADVVIRPFEPADARAVHTVVVDAFAEWEGQFRLAYEDWHTRHVERDGADTSHWRVATAAGEVVGAAVVHDSDGATWVHQLAVRADHRGQGIAQGLLAEAYDAGRRRGCLTGELATSSRSGALPLYERLGMRVVGEFESWQLRLGQP
ncbi:GNAT family N-acetyltransferase [Aeromicrobium chenweiae]|uniref:GNAT family N-acetyltransferase n=1 Tax=Aeromicrobium chenweiae TaxID=2079793 RepID=A0A2S0WJY2_9ACTN|nr:GNAT family N-acetyltransferase [Aeromicrobium chenweiae]AWB91550.1 GNAT family N-acetyltransferase [Aeromicrobium chenweiae]TGN32385.1 GNAT family N-acetyltransferase [Aeromicrobium chenweiae]